MRIGLRLTTLAITLIFAYLTSRLVLLLLQPLGRAVCWRFGQWVLRQFLRFSRWLFGVELDIDGALPARGSLVIANHHSYLDIVAIGSIVPSFFLAKHEVSQWPLIGGGAVAIGVPFVQRGNPSSRAAAATTIVERLRAGHTVVLFPEGTTSTRREPLPFRSGIFRSIAGSPVTVAPVQISYDDPRAHWVDDDTFVRHLVALAAHRRTKAKLIFAVPLRAESFEDGYKLRDMTWRAVTRPCAAPPPAADDLSWLRRPWLRRAKFSNHRDAAIIHVFDQPGRWMSGAELEELQQDLSAIAADAIDEPLTYGIFSGRRSAFTNRVVALAYNKRREPIGFTAMVYLPYVRGGQIEPVIHLGLTMIRRAYHSRRLQTPLFRRVFLLPVLNQRRIEFTITNIAASPAGVGATCDYFDGVFPHYAGSTSRTPFHMNVAQQILGRFRTEFGCSASAQFDPETFVVRGSNQVTGGEASALIKEDPVSRYRIDSCNRFCAKQLDFTRGDELFQVGRARLLRGLWPSPISQRRDVV
jgi:1-acyl-sn-glycerol-3-phosphate acyltransferase